MNSHSPRPFLRSEICTLLTSQPSTKMSRQHNHYYQHLVEFIPIIAITQLQIHPNHILRHSIHKLLKKHIFKFDFIKSKAKNLHCTGQVSRSSFTGQGTAVHSPADYQDVSVPHNTDCCHPAPHRPTCTNAASPRHDPAKQCTRCPLASLPVLSPVYSNQTSTNLIQN